MSEKLFTGQFLPTNTPFSQHWTTTQPPTINPQNCTHFY